MRSGVFISCALLVALVFSPVSRVFGSGYPSDREVREEIRELRRMIREQNARIAELEDRVSGQQCRIERHTNIIEKKSLRDVSGRMKNQLERLVQLGGLQIGAGATFVAQGTPGANKAGAARFGGSWSSDVEIAREFGDTGMAFLHMEAGQGDTIEGYLSVFSNVNRDAGDTEADVQITEAWYEQYLFDRQVSVTGGKIDATAYIDTNEYANDESSQFLGHIFRNSSVIDWPDDNNPGVRIYISPGSVNFMDIEAVYMEEGGGLDNLFAEPFIAAQLNFMPAKAFGYDEQMWGGNCRAYFWYNRGPRARVQDPDVVEKGNTGFGFSVDQKITDVYGVFGRFGWSSPQKNDPGYDWSAGGRMTGRYWKREEDVVAAAVGQVIPGKGYRGGDGSDKAETHLEAYYAFKVNDHLTLSPGMQIIWQPEGCGTLPGKDPDAVFVYGIRGQVDL